RQLPAGHPARELRLAPLGLHARSHQHQRRPLLLVHHRRVSARCLLGPRAPQVGVRRTTMERKQRAATLSWVFLAILAAGLVLVNALGHMTNKRIDATKNEQFTLSQGSARLVR